MAFIPSENAQNLSKQTAVEPNLILEIEGIPIIFGSQDISKVWKLDDGFEFDAPNLRFDTPVPDPNSRDYINLEKTSKNISQQVLPDKKGTSSTLSLDIALIDFNGEVTELFKAGNNVEDIIGQRASTYIGFKQGTHPADSIPLLDGYIQMIKPIAGGYILTVAHSENKKRQNLFEPYTATLSANIDDSTTTIPVTSTKQFIESSDLLTSYIQIDDEIMEVVSVDSATQFTVVRSRLNTLATSHETEADISSIYELIGDAIDLSLRLYMSGGDEYYTTLNPTAFLQVNSEIIANSIFFQDISLSDDINVTVGDSINIAGSTSNNGIYNVVDIVNVSNGSYLVVSESLTLESPTSATIDFKSLYNTLGEGCGLTPFDVDIATHRNEQSENSSSFPIYTARLKEAISAKEFVDGELYYPSGLYSIMRSAKISCAFTRPPLVNEQAVLFNTENILNIQNINVTRSVNSYCYNEIAWRFDQSVKDDAFKAGVLNVNPGAKERVDKTRHTLKIDSVGLRRTADTTSLIDRQTNRFYQRYQYGATLYAGIQVHFYDAWNLEVGDVIEFGGEDVQIPDTNAGTTYTPRKYLEIINKKQNIETQVISFDCLETGFDLNARFGVFSPASNITANSTATRLELSLSYFTGQVVRERQKWQQFVGERIRVRSEDYSFDEITTILSLAAENDEVLNIEALPSAPLEGYIVEIPKYDESSAEIDKIYKGRYTYASEQKTVGAVTDAQIFELDDASNFQAGMLIQVRAEDYTNDSGDNGVEILTVVANTITLVEPLDFIPLVGYVVERLTFKDDNFTYRLI
jgi:hypothetical protein